VYRRKVYSSVIYYKNFFIKTTLIYVHFQKPVFTIFFKITIPFSSDTCPGIEHPGSVFVSTIIFVNIPLFV